MSRQKSIDTPETRRVLPAVVRSIVVMSMPKAPLAQQWAYIRMGTCIEDLHGLKSAGILEQAARRELLGLPSALAQP
jgi:hypothetical protein